MKRTNRTAKIITQLHGLSFTIFAIISVAFNYYIYPILTEKISTGFIVILLDAIISAFLYTVIYFILTFIYKIVIFRLKNKNHNLKGVWYHVHLKRNMHGFVAVKSIRAGITKVTQDFYDLDFSAENYSYSLNADNQLEEKSGATNKTHWNYCATDWSGDDIIACYTASSADKKKITQCPFCGAAIAEGQEVSGESKERIGVHRLKIIDKNEIRGTFADQYPSASFGEIFFFRKKEDRDRLIMDFLTDGDLDEFV
ncbi:MAG: hypothetical protein ACI4QI_03755 [Candidatus Coproplasma sp.]